MPRVSLAGIEVLEDLLQNVRRVQDELRARTDDKSRGLDLRTESITSSLQDASSRLEAAMERESTIRAECLEAEAAVQDAHNRISSLESELE